MISNTDGKINPLTEVLPSFALAFTHSAASQHSLFLSYFIETSAFFKMLVLFHLKAFPGLVLPSALSARLTFL